MGYKSEKSLLLVIDMQNGFINQETRFLIDKINDLIINKSFDDVVYTRFINRQGSVFVNKLGYMCCLTEEENRIVVKVNNYKIIDKTSYSAVNDELENYLKNNDITSIYVCGVDTECCVMLTATDLFENGYNVYVLKDYCACTRGDLYHENALDILRYNIGENSII